MESILNAIGIATLIYFAFVWIIYLIFLLATFRTVIKKYDEAKHNTILSTWNQNWLPPLSIIIPAYNEKNRIRNTITSILNSDYKNTHIIVVNDGSTDDMLQVLINEYSLKKIPPAFKKKIITGEVRAYYQSTIIPNFIVVDKEHSPFENTGADCINAGLNTCRTPLFITLDADTILETNALSEMIFLYLTTPHCIAIGGDIYVPDPDQIKEGKLMQTNIPSNPVLGVQVCEYLRSFLYGREGWSLVGGSLCHPGAFTLLETKAVYDVGGYDPYCFSYDAEIILKLHRVMREQKYPYAIIYAPSAIAWSEAPKTVKQLWSQRSHWQKGLLRCVGRHKKMICNPHYGISGLLAFPYYIGLEIFGPVVEAIAFITLILTLFFSSVSLSIFAWLIFLAWGYLMTITMACVVLNVTTYNKYHTKTDILRIFLLTTLDMIFYRPVRAMSALVSSIQYLFGYVH